MPQFKSTWHRMRELVVLSLNIILIKDTLQQCERMRAKLHYINFSEGPVSVLELELHARKRALNKRVKVLLEDVMNATTFTIPKYKIDSTNYTFNIDFEHACLTKKQLDKGYALFNNVRDNTFALNLRNGALLPITNYEQGTPDGNLASLEYTAQHEGSVLKYFDIDSTDPLKDNLRY